MGRSEEKEKGKKGWDKRKKIALAAAGALSLVVGAFLAGQFFVGGDNHSSAKSKNTKKTADSSHSSEEQPQKHSAKRQPAGHGHHKAQSPSKSSKSKKAKKQASATDSNSKGDGVEIGVLSAIESIHEKVQNIKRLDEQNERLRLENATLRNWVETLKYECSLKKSREKTEKTSLALKEKTGLEIGRALASVSYRPPSELLPRQLEPLGVSYFKEQSYEKSAVIFTYLTHLKKNETYKRPKHYLLAGVSWYRIDNLKLAGFFFDRILEFDAKKELLKYQAQARLWKALAARRLGNRKKAQYWLEQLVDHHPHSREAKWVNQGGKGRVPASH